MKRRSMPLAAAAILLAAVLLISCSGDAAKTAGDPVAGKRLFAESGCNGCHTFKAAGSTGTQGPDLDEAQPSPAKVVRQLEHPGGLMPSFADKLSESEKRDLAAFVGAGNSSGKAVAAPFRPDSKRLVGLPRRQLRLPRAGVRQPDLQRGSRGRARAPARRTPPRTPPSRATATASRTAWARPRSRASRTRSRRRSSPARRSARRATTTASSSAPSSASRRTSSASSRASCATRRRSPSSASSSTSASTASATGS